MVFLASNVMKSEHLANLAEILNSSKWKRTLPILQSSKHRMTWKPDTTSGVFLGLSIMFSQKVKLHVPKKKNSFPITLKFVDFVGRTTATLNVFASKSMTSGTSMVPGSCLGLPI